MSTRWSGAYFGSSEIAFREQDHKSSSLQSRLVTHCMIHDNLYTLTYMYLTQHKTV